MKLLALLALLIGLYVTVRLAVSRYRRPEPPAPQAQAGFAPPTSRGTAVLGDVSEGASSSAIEGRIIWQEASVRPPAEKRTVEAPAFLPPVQVHKVGRSRRKAVVPSP